MSAVELVSEEIGSSNRRFGARLADGSLVEAVHYRGDTLCISSQVGCAVRCPFCASGANGLGRSLSREELVGQLEAVRARGLAVIRSTVSGVGEPLHNAENVFAYLDDARRLGAPASVTTTGGPLPRLRELLHAPHNGVTVSVHAGTEETRARAVPKGPALAPLFDVLRDEIPRLGRNRRKKVALAYLMIPGINESAAELDAFAALSRPLGVAVHLYAYNPVPNGDFDRAPRERYESAYERLRGAGLVVRMSSQARIEANGGCGTLVAARTPSAGGDRGPLASRTST
ncbi:MAG: radical SAM protein [Polyangiales bacterium]